MTSTTINSLMKLMNCHQCYDGNVMGLCIKQNKIYKNNKWHVQERPIFLCKKHFLNKKKLNKEKHNIHIHNQKVIEKLSIISNIKINNNLGSDKIDQLDLNLLINGLKYIKKCN